MDGWGMLNICMRLVNWGREEVCGVWCDWIEFFIISLLVLFILFCYVLFVVCIRSFIHSSLPLEACVGYSFSI